MRKWFEKRARNAVSGELAKLEKKLKGYLIDANENKIFSINNFCDGFKYQKAYPKPIYFYLPQATSDFVQSEIALNSDFYSYDILERAKKYIPENAFILDIGANIGNHSLYYALICGAKKVFSFEPIKSTFEILVKNIELNNASDCIKAHNFALGSQKSKGEIAAFYNDNIGGTSIKASESGNLDIETLDNLTNNNMFGDKIDFVKIDVETFESEVLMGGGGGFLKIYKPILMIEIFAPQWDKTIAILNQNNYELIQAVSPYDFVFGWRK